MNAYITKKEKLIIFTDNRNKIVDCFEAQRILHVEDLQEMKKIILKSKKEGDNE